MIIGILTVWYLGLAQTMFATDRTHISSLILVPGNGAETIGDTAALSFSGMPAVDLPDKGAVVTLG